MIDKELSEEEIKVIFEKAQMKNTYVKIVVIFLWLKH